MNFLKEYESIPWNCKEYNNINCKRVLIGKGNNALEVLITSSNNRPTKNELQNVWNLRKGRRANPLLLVNLYKGSAVICGISGDDPTVIRDLDIQQVERMSKVGLNKPNRHSAYRFLKDRLNKLDSELMGIVNQGLLSTHELKEGVPNREDWEQAVNKSKTILEYEDKELILGLGYGLEELDRNSYILKDENRDTAVAIFLDEGVSFEQPQETFNSKSPVNWALKRADEKRIPFVIANSGKTLRLYSTNPEDGFGSRGRTDTYVEANLDLLTKDNCGYLWLLYSAEALKDNGKLYEILDASKDYAIGLGERLKERIYDEVIPELAEGIASARNLIEPDKQELDQTYRMALLVLFRLLFIAYAEDEKFLPYNQNSRYTDHSLKKKVHSLEDLLKEDIELDSQSTSHWDEFNRLVEAIHNGNAEWGLPKYNGRLLSSDVEISSEGSIISDIELTNDCFGNILINLLIDETKEGYKGAIDFRNLGVREFGVIYEGLLESELSIADRDLKLNKDNKYIPVKSKEDILISKGEIYLHGTSGERKATGSYYTKNIFVEHLLEKSLKPALKAHLEYIDTLNIKEAEEEFFNFKIADIAMGSGHFLISAIDRAEKEFSKYLTDNNLPRVEEELDRLRHASKQAFNNKNMFPEVDDSQLLRRQIARRCIYGVDLNKTAVDLARLSVWVHTFIPGLPLTFLNHNLVMGNSLAGIGTLKEAAEILEEEEQNLFSHLSDNKKRLQEIKEKVRKIGKLADADAKEVSKARKLQEELKIKTSDYQKLFDILSASRLVENINPGSIFNKIENINEISEIKEHEIAKKRLKNINLLHFPLVFPEIFQNDGDKEGFDVIIGNPPWEKPRVKLEEFWARHYPGLRSLNEQKMKKQIIELKEKRPDLVGKYEREKESQDKIREILVKGPFKGITQGDPDLYQAFLWRFWDLLKNNGYLGVVLPREAFGQSSSEVIRKELINQGKIIELIFLKNSKKWIFEDIHPQMTICLVSVQKNNEGKYVPIKGPFDNINSFNQNRNEKPYKFSVENVKKWTDKAIFPLLPAKRSSLKIFEKIQKHPRIDAKNNFEWNIKPFRTGITSNDCIDKDEIKNSKSDYWPVFKGASFNLWESDTGIYYGWADKEYIIKKINKKIKRSRKWEEHRDELPCMRPRIAFRRITNRTNRRTLIVSLIPPKVFLRDGDPFLLWPKGSIKDEAYLLSILSSIPTDWFVRRFTEKYMGYYIFNGIPVPRVGKNNILRKRLIELTGKLVSVDKRFKNWVNELGIKIKSLKNGQNNKYIYEIDAIVGHLYRLNKNDLKVIFETFHKNWNYKPRLEKVLKYYEKWEDKL